VFCVIISHKEKRGNLKKWDKGFILKGLRGILECHKMSFCYIRSSNLKSYPQRRLERVEIDQGRSRRLFSFQVYIFLDELPLEN
jgi:hypothetical protein